ncbi:transcriptional regulator, GntR family [Lachnospiraceae bacterium KM106-2]|nr:transcriptional regulator, GntR family [Lachnospiraceae bacterium KM106-2]
MDRDDTVKLLKECNAGVKTAVTSIDEILPKVQEDELKRILGQSKQDHEKIGDQTHIILNEYRDSEKDPNPIAKAMSYMKINMKMIQNPNDHEVADLMTDGCNMGIKSIHKYLNQYDQASSNVKQLSMDLIQLEENLRKDLCKYL